MKKAIMYGAGNIGRGFIGQLLSQSGYEVVFIDVNVQVVEELNVYRKYPITFTSEKGNYEIVIENVRAVNGMDLEAVAMEIADADIVATAVGVNVLPRIALPLARGLQVRWKCNNMRPINIIICENLIDANQYLKELIRKELEDSEKSFLDEMTGFVEASIGRMVPVMTPEMQEGNILRVCVEEFGELPVDRNGFKGAIPEIKNMVPFSPFEYYIQRKLFIHNMGHAITAYLGYLKGYNYIWEAIEDSDIRRVSRCAMMESAEAISKEHGIDMVKIQEHVDDLIYRFGNRLLGDTVERVGRDLQRKLSPNDRLVGALNLCTKHNIWPIHIYFGIAAALSFKDLVIFNSSSNSETHTENNTEVTLEKVCQIKINSKEWMCIVHCCKILKNLK